MKRPFEENLPLSQMLLNQQDLTIVNTLTEKRKLPETPLERVYSAGNLGTPVRASIVGVNKDSTSK